MIPLSAPTGAQQISYSLSGTNAANYAQPATSNIFIAPLNTISKPTYPAKLFVGQAYMLVLTLSQPPSAKVTLTINGPSFSTGAITWTSASSTTQSVQCAALQAILLAVAQLCCTG